MQSDDQAVLAKLQRGGEFDRLNRELSEQIRNDVRLCVYLLQIWRPCLSVAVVCCCSCQFAAFQQVIKNSALLACCLLAACSCLKHFEAEAVQSCQGAASGCYKYAHQLRNHS